MPRDSTPYLKFARWTGTDYGLVLNLAHLLEVSAQVNPINGPAWNTRFWLWVNTAENSLGDKRLAHLLLATIVREHKQREELGDERIKDLDTEAVNMLFNRSTRDGSQETKRS
jgi:hypothetical protein